MRTLRTFLLLLAVAALFGLGGLLRHWLGIGLSADAIRLRVDTLGWAAPALFLGLLTFRTFLAIPSSLLLVAGGLLFGVGPATLLGGLGVFLAALLWFGLARLVGRDWVRSRLGGTFEQLEPQLRRAGPLIVGVATAHPAGPTTPVHVAAGIASLSPVVFVFVTALASPARAFAYALFGSALVEVGSSEFYAATALMVSLFGLPLVHPALRRRLFGRRTEPGPGGSRRPADPS